MVNGWKVIAIIFIVLFTMETSLIVWGVILVNQNIEKENECIFNVCENYPRYIYYEIESVCECYNDDSELIRQRYLG